MLVVMDPPPPDIYTLSLPDALPISCRSRSSSTKSSASSSATRSRPTALRRVDGVAGLREHQRCGRSEEHTSELQSRFDLVCRLLLEKKKPARTSGVLSRAQ